MKISATIISFNEEERIEATLRSLDFVDEIVVVDAYSSDATVEIARRYGAKVYLKEWKGYASQRNFALKVATYDWILNIDADEVVSPQLREEILKIKEKEPDCDAFLIKRRTFYLGKPILHCGWYPEEAPRLFRKEKARWEGEYVHERLIVEGKRRKLSGEVLHYSYRSFSEHVERTVRYAKLWAKRERGRRVTLLHLLLGPPLSFLKVLLLQKGFLDGWRGVIISAMAAFYTFLKYSFAYTGGKDEGHN